MNKLDKAKLLFTIYKDQPIPEKKWYEIEKNYPDVEFEKLKREIINYQIDKYGQELKYYYFGERHRTTEELKAINKVARDRRRNRFVKKEIF